MEYNSSNFSPSYVLNNLITHKGNTKNLSANDKKALSGRNSSRLGMLCPWKVGKSFQYLPFEWQLHVELHT